MKILLVEDLQLAPYLEELGCEVYTCSTEDAANYNFLLSSLCKKLGIDVFLQVESLSNRSIILDIGEITALKIYYAIDIHLNYYWQKEYKKFFDIFISTQKNFSADYWLPWGVNFKKKFQFLPFSKRKYDISFVGLIDENRLKRKNIINNIKNFFNIYIKGDTLQNRISYEETLKIYNNSRIVINESINNEINFRYFEATYAGALLFTEEINNGENILFKINEEILTFKPENLLEKLEFYIEHPDISEKIAYNAWQNSTKNHSLLNRAKEIIKIIKKNKLQHKQLHSLPLKSLFLVMLRGISANNFFPLKETSEDIYGILIKFYFKKINSPLNAADFLKKYIKKNNHPLIYFNYISTLIEEKKIEVSINNFLKFSIKSINKLIKEKKSYTLGFVNNGKTTIILTAFDIILFLFNHFLDVVMKNKEINLLAANILISANNFQSAIYYLLNNTRNFPDDILTRKYLAKCYYKIFSIELYHIENLKILLLEREFEKFKNYKTNIENKKIGILDIVEHIKDKKFVRDISIKLSEFIQ